VFILFHSTVPGEMNVLETGILGKECVAFLRNVGVFNETFRRAHIKNDSASAQGKKITNKFKNN
jgi:hypothetical protein